MSCRSYSRKIVQWLDKELPPHEQEALTAWYDRCASHRQCTRCNAYKTLHYHLSQSHNPSPALPSHIHARIMAEVVNRSGSAASLPHPFWRSVQVAAAIMLSLYLGTVISARTFTTTPSGSSSDTASTQYSYGETSLLDVFVDTEVTP